MRKQKRNILIGISIFAFLFLIIGFGFNLFNISFGLYDVNCIDQGDKLIRCYPNSAGISSTDSEYQEFAITNMYDLYAKDFGGAFGEVLREDPTVNKFLTETTQCDRSGATIYYRISDNYANLGLYSAFPLNAWASNDVSRKPCYSMTYAINGANPMNALLGNQYIEVPIVIKDGGDRYGAIKGRATTYGICNLTSATCNISFKEVNITGISQPFFEINNMIIHLELGSITMQQACFKLGKCQTPIIPVEPVIVIPSPENELIKIITNTSLTPEEKVEIIETINLTIEEKQQIINESSLSVVQKEEIQNQISPKISLIYIIVGIIAVLLVIALLVLVVIKLRKN
jgi:hypothetical protein